MLGDSDESSTQRGRNDSNSQSQLQAVPPPPKRKRTSKATTTQFEELVAKLEARPFLATKRFTGLQGRENFEVGWREVALDLNQSPNGAVKTPDQWMTVWRTFKSRCCTKAAKFNRDKAQTGNRGVNTPPLTELERRVISLVGVEYTVGTSCPDAMPEEDAVQRDLEAGVVVDTFIDLSHSNQQDQQDNIDTYIVADPVMTNYAISTAAEQPISQQPSQSVLVINSEPSTSQQALEITTSDRNSRESRQQTQPRRNRGLNPRRSIAELQNSARSDFLTVAQSNADAMKVLAAATKLQAEAAKIQAEAAKTQAEAMMMFAETTNKMWDVLKEHFKK